MSFALSAEIILVMNIVETIWQFKIFSLPTYLDNSRIIHKKSEVCTSCGTTCKNYNEYLKIVKIAIEIVLVKLS